MSCFCKSYKVEFPELKREILELLENLSLDMMLSELKKYPSLKVVNILIGAFLHKNEVVKWKSVVAFGECVRRIAEEDLEKARIIIRRLMWMLNEESGGMGWGVPEGFAEALYRSERLKNEYLSIFVSYIWKPKEERKYKADNYLEFPPAQRGVIWGIGRLAQIYKSDLIERKAHLYTYEHLSSSDKLVRFFSIWTLDHFRPFEKEFGFDEDYIHKVKEELKRERIRVLFFDGKSIDYKELT